MRRAIFVVIVTLAFAAPAVHASGPVGVFGMIERVVFEPSESAPERVQVWGAFAYADLWTGGTQGTSVPRRGYLYFRLPSGPDSAVVAVTREWADLKTVAGTGQAVGFGSWGYIGGFAQLDPSVRSSSPPYILEMYPGRGELTDMRVRPATEPPAQPAVYQTNAGIVKLSDAGSRADVVRQLRALLQAK